MKLIYILISISLCYSYRITKYSINNIHSYKKCYNNNVLYNSNNNNKYTSNDNFNDESLSLFANNFVNSWKKALCKGDYNSLFDLIPTSTSIKWDNPYISNSNDLKEGIKQFKSFFGDQEPSITVFNLKQIDHSKFKINYQLSFWYPIFWKPRIIIPIESYVTITSDFKNLVSVIEKWEFSLLDIIIKQFIPRLWDIWHIIQTPVPEYPPIKYLGSSGKVSFVEMPQTLCIETKTICLNKYPGPPLSVVPGFSLFGKLRTSRPNRDPIYPIMPVEIQSTTFLSTNGEQMKKSSWIYHVPTSLQEKIIDKINICFPINDIENVIEESDDTIDEVDFETTIQDKGLMKSVTAGTLRGNITYDEVKITEYEKFLTKDYEYKFLSKRILAQTDIYGEIDLKKINDAISLIKKAVATQGKILFGNNIRIINRDTDLESKIISKMINSPSIDECNPKVGLQLWDCKGCFNPNGEPAMAVYEIQFDSKLTKVFVELTNN